MSWRQLRSSKCRKQLPPFHLKAGNKFSFSWRQTLISPGRHQRNLQTNLVKLTLIFLVTFSSFTTPSPNPFALSILHRFIVWLSKRYKNFLLWLLLWVFILCDGSHVHEKIQYNLYALLLFICLCQFNFHTQPGTLRGSGKTFYSSTLTTWKNNKSRSLPHPSLEDNFQKDQIYIYWVFPGGPVVKTTSFQCRERGFDAWWRN